jgi:hypothetical protein
MCAIIILPIPQSPQFFLVDLFALRELLAKLGTNYSLTPFYSVLPQFRGASIRKCMLSAQCALKGSYGSHSRNV